MTDHANSLYLLARDKCVARELIMNKCSYVSGNVNIHVLNLEGCMGAIGRPNSLDLGGTRLTSNKIIRPVAL